MRYASTRLWNPTPNALGMRGELALAILFGAEPDLRIRPDGDYGVDLEVLLRVGVDKQWFVIDVKTANGPKELLVNTEKLRPDTIYVLAGPGDEGPIACLGWEWGRVMAREPTTAWSGNDAIVHHKKRGLLRSMKELKDRYCGWWRHYGLEAQPAKEEKDDD